jgi:integrase/recombinase XerD
MKHLTLSTASFRYIEQGFKEWLTVLGYSWQVVYYMPLHVRELLHYLESQNKHQLSSITAAVIREYYYNVLRERTNHTAGAGALSNESLNKHLDALKKFSDYLRQSGRLLIAPLDIRQEVIDEARL